MGDKDGPRGRLLADRAAVAGRLVDLRREFDGIVAAAEHANADDEHDPEGATIAFERQHLASLVERAMQRLAEIDEALGRLDGGVYGTCERCGLPIPAQRLAARPSAATCVSCARAR